MCSEALEEVSYSDEADTFLFGRDDLRGILNSGHCRASAYVVRAEGGGARSFSTWAPCAVALIGRLPPTLEDRSVAIAMERRQRGEAVERLQAGKLLEELLPLRRRAARWALDAGEALRAAEPPVPPELDDRAADNWRPLLALADEAGGRWPEAARRAAVLLSRARLEEEESPELQALAGLAEAFARTGASALSSRQVIELLAADEEGSWAAGRGRRALTPHQLALLLRPFGIRPILLRLSGGPCCRGYLLDQCLPVFRRYLPSFQPLQPLQA